jgi:hypothetical protein
MDTLFIEASRMISTLTVQLPSLIPDPPYLLILLGQPYVAERASPHRGFTSLEYAAGARWSGTKKRTGDIHRQCIPLRSPLFLSPLLFILTRRSTNHTIIHKDYQNGEGGWYVIYPRCGPSPLNSYAN